MNAREYCDVCAAHTVEKMVGVHNYDGHFIAP